MSTHFPDGHEREVDEVERPEPLPNYYDQGWNARVAGKPFTSASSRSWQDGWKDCDSVPEAERAPMGDPPPLPLHLTDVQIKHMVDRFLGWKLPESFSPDGGVSFKRTFNDHLPTPTKNEPSGTNVFDAEQATAMVRYMVDGLPKATTTPTV